MSGKRIQEIIERLDSLTLEANTLTKELRTLTSAQEDEDKPEAKQKVYPAGFLHDFRRGDRVKITNTYKGNKGKKGTVTSVTKTQVTLIDSDGETHTRRFSNVQLTD